MLDLLREFLNNLSEPRALGGGNPFQSESLALNPEIIQHQPYRLSPFFRFHITILVMAVSDVSTAHQNTVGTFC